MRKYKVADHLLVTLSGGRIVEATIKAILETTNGVRAAGVIWRRDGADLFVANRSGGSLIRESKQGIGPGERRWVKLRGNLRRSRI